MDSKTRLLVLTAGSIFATETLVMLILSYLPSLSTPVEAFIHALLLGAMLFIVLYTYYFPALNERHERLEASGHEQRLTEIIFRESNEGIVITDRDNRILRVNPAFTRITGYTAEEAVGKNPKLLSSGRHDRAFYETLWHQVNTAGSWSGEIWNRRKNGQVYPEWLSIRAVKNPAGETLHHMAIFSDITQRKHSEEKIRVLANYDPLTGLPNRSLLDDRLRQARELALRDKNGFAVIFIDLDRFKPVNDTLGHAVGDKLLQEAARRMLACVRNIDTVARFGGDEFLVILQDVPLKENASPVAQKIVTALSHPFKIDQHEITISASAGIAHWDAKHAADKHDLSELIQQADKAMYQAKEAGRGSYRLWEE